ncbi:hypothetical protein ACFWE0_01170, partial [Streptomyces diastaticus]
GCFFFFFLPWTASPRAPPRPGAGAGRPRPLAPPHPLPGPEAGPANRFAYLRTPWGSTLELVTYPDPQPYARHTDRRRWRPRPASGPQAGQDG